ncbi:MAG TPA: hypothetical protein VHZ24_12610 [Pirellulales bacterium]|jgi:hypothetical protein|nr:hypothetical protein [Pirellulales bacterium]
MRTVVLFLLIVTQALAKDIVLTNGIVVREGLPELLDLPAETADMTRDEFVRWARGQNEQARTLSEQRSAENRLRYPDRHGVASNGSNSGTTLGNLGVGALGYGGLGAFGGGGGYGAYGVGAASNGNAGFAPGGGYGGGYFGRNGSTQSTSYSSQSYDTTWHDPNDFGPGPLTIINPYVHPRDVPGFYGR